MGFVLRFLTFLVKLPKIHGVHNPAVFQVDFEHLGERLPKLDKPAELPLWIRTLLKSGVQPKFVEFILGCSCNGHRIYCRIWFLEPKVGMQRLQLEDYILFGEQIRVGRQQFNRWDITLGLKVYWWHTFGIETLWFSFLHLRIWIFQSIIIYL